MHSSKVVGTVKLVDFRAFWALGGVTRRMRVLVITSSLLLLALSCQGLQYQHDELLWTKSRWQDYKLSFPWAAFLKARDAESVRQLEGPLHGFSAHSLNGPLLDAAELERQVEEEALRRARGWAGFVGRLPSPPLPAAASPPAARPHTAFAALAPPAGAPGCSRAASS